MIRLHHCPQTRSMRTLWLLHELGVEFDVVEHPFDKSLRDPSYLALNPAGRVPALELEGNVYFETGALTEILCERFPDSGLGRAVGDPDRPDWLVWVHFSETISQHTAALTQQHVALYEDAMRSPIVMKLEAARLAKCFLAVEGRLERRLNLLGEAMSAADISVAQAVYMGKHFVKIEDFPRLKAWYERLSQRSAFQASLPQGNERLYNRDFYEPWS